MGRDGNDKQNEFNGKNLHAKIGLALPVHVFGHDPDWVSTRCRACRVAGWKRRWSGVGGSFADHWNPRDVRLNGRATKRSPRAFAFQNGC